MTLIADFKTRFPEFDADLVDEVLPNLEAVWPCYYGGDFDKKCDREVIFMLLAHLFVEESNSSSASVQPVASETVGNVSVSFASGTTNMNRLWPHFGATRYGARFLLLTNKNIGAKFV